MPSRQRRLVRLCARIRTLRSARLQLEALETRIVPTLLGNNVFPADNPWNQIIANAPVAANSTSIMNAIIGKYGDGHLHPDFGQDTQTNNPLYGIPYNVVHGNTQPKVNVVIDAYASESDVQPAPVPANAVIEGDQQNGPTVGLANRGDSHLLVYDEDNNIEYEFGAASRPSENSDGQWHADQESVWNFNTNTFRTIGYTSADAAGLPILPGLARPDEGLTASQGGQGAITHALRMTLQNSVILDQFLFPASHIANPGNTNTATQPPMGARFRLKASVNISTLNPESGIIAQALQNYGLIVADNGSNFFFTGASYSENANGGFGLTWNDSDIQDSVHGLKSLTFSDFEVVDLTPVVTGLSATTGPAGTTVTVTGQNFSGAAGHLQVLFGSTPATNVHVVDDGHVTAVVPAGSGTVDVRVQSGISDPADSANIKSPVFGYGTSATTASDQFTYNAVSDPNVLFVTQAYQDILNRAPDPGGLAYWSGLLANGAPRTGVAQGMTHSAEYFSHFVAAAYQQFLGRAADAGGLQYWTGQMQLGLTNEQLQALLLASPECYGHAGNNDKAWIDSIYQSLLGRAADAGGESYWLQQLAQGVGRATVAYGFTVSAEADGIRVRADYQHYLARAATQAEVDSAVALFGQGLTDETLVAGLVGSDEYYHRVTGL
jgi:hypothetical protein